jgi:hypothetical protein
MWVKEIKHAIMDGTIGLILKRVKDENFNTKNSHVIKNKIVSSICL